MCAPPGCFLVVSGSDAVQFWEKLRAQKSKPKRPFFPSAPGLLQSLLLSSSKLLQTYAGLALGLLVLSRSVLGCFCLGCFVTGRAPRGRGHSPLPPPPSQKASHRGFPAQNLRPCSLSARSHLLLLGEGGLFFPRRGQMRLPGYGLFVRVDGCCQHHTPCHRFLRAHQRASGASSGKRVTTPASATVAPSQRAAAERRCARSEQSSRACL